MSLCKLSELRDSAHHVQAELLKVPQAELAVKYCCQQQAGNSMKMAGITDVGMPQGSYGKSLS